MITLLRFLQQVARVQSRSMGDAELGAIWLLTAVTFVAVGCQLVSLTFRVNIGRILNSKDPIRAVRSTPRGGPSPKRTMSRAATVTYVPPTQNFFQKTVLQTATRIKRVVGLRKGRRKADPSVLATS